MSEQNTRYSCLTCFPHLYLVVVDLVPEPVSVGGVGADVTAGKVGHDETFSRERQIHGRNEARRRVQRAKEVAERRVNQDGTGCRVETRITSMRF